MYCNDVSLRGADDTFEYTEERINDLKRCAKDPIYFIEKYIKIISEGRRVDFKLRDYQKDYVNHVCFGKKVIAMFPRQCGKSTTTGAIIVWYIIFNSHKHVLLLADQNDHATEQMDRIKEMIRELPLWLQQGVKVWNQKKIEFTNKSRIKCASTTIKSGTGDTTNFLYLDEFSKVDERLAKEFMASVIPTVSSDPNAKIVVTSTPLGFNHFYDMWMNAQKNKNNPETDSYYPLTIPWDAVPGRDAAFRAKMIEEFNGDVTKFEREFNCKFEGSVPTLIELDTINKMIEMWAEEPKCLLDGDRLKIYRGPVSEAELKENGWQYLITMDPAMGTKQDFTACHVWLIKDNLDVEEVAVYHSNDIDPMTMVDKILCVCKMYYNPNVLIETMEPAGGAIVNTLLNVKNYYNLISMQREGFGFRMHHELKIKSCTLLQAYCNKYLLKIHDKKTYKELAVFGKKGNSYKAVTTSAHDDLVMSTISMLYFINSDYYFGNINSSMSICDGGESILNNNDISKLDPEIREAIDRANGQNNSSEFSAIKMVSYSQSNSRVNEDFISDQYGSKYMHGFDDAVNMRQMKDNYMNRSNPKFAGDINPYRDGNAMWYTRGGM